MEKPFILKAIFILIIKFKRGCVKCKFAVLTLPLSKFHLMTKYILFILLFILFTDHLYANNIDSTEWIVSNKNVSNLLKTNYNMEQKLYKHTYLWKKHKTQNVIGGVCLGAGVATASFWVALKAITNGYSGSKGLTPIDKGLLATSIGLSVASIPLFVFAHKNKKKAMSLSINSKNIYMPLPNGTIQRQPSLAFSINF